MTPSAVPAVRLLAAPLALAIAAAPAAAQRTAGPAEAPAPAVRRDPPKPDPRVGLKAGLMNAGEAAWNLKVLSRTPSTDKFLGNANTDLAFKDNYVFQGNYNGWQVWDIGNRAAPKLVTSYYCPASQSDVSVYGNLLFVSGEGLEGRLDCGDQGVKDRASRDRLRGLRIYDITDLKAPKNVGNVQTCRGSHTHTVLVDPTDRENVYVYISGSAGVRPEEELPGCVGAPPEKDPNSALFRIEVIKVPVKNPAAAAIVSSPRIFNDLAAPPRHGPTAEDRADSEKRVAEAKARGAFVAQVDGQTFVLPDRMVKPVLDSIARARGAAAPSAEDSAKVRETLGRMMATMNAQRTRVGPTQCHDITVYPAIGLAGGACEGYGLLLDISDPANPKRISAVADSNFSYWHSATFTNDGSKILFSDEWGGGGQPKCRDTDPMEWGADALFTIENRQQMTFKGYYKLPAPQTRQENCVAHNGSMIPIPGRDVMVQSWYQGGISVFDWTDPSKPVEIAYHDRGPVDSTKMAMGGSWSVYWYNGAIVNSEIARGLDIFELTPSEYLSQNELDAANTVKLTYLNAQGQPQYVWPPSFALVKAYADQLERSQGLAAGRLAAVRGAIASAEKAKGGARRSALTKLATQLEQDASQSGDARKVAMLADALRALAKV